jgi:putative heme-binding domain-containing protein
VRARPWHAGNGQAKLAELITVIPSVARAFPTLVKPKSVSPLDETVALPQPAAEWSRLESEVLLARMGRAARDHVTAFTRLANSPLDHRLAAIRLLAADYEKLTLTKIFAADRKPEIRAQAAWLAGLRGGDDLEFIKPLLRDEDAFVRRRAWEALTRHASIRNIEDIVTSLADEYRTVRYTAMIVLSHLPTDAWFSRLEDSSNPQVLLRALTAAALRNQKPKAKSVQGISKKLTNLQDPKITTREDLLDLMRVLALYELEIKATGADQEVTFVRAIASNDPDISWERARLLGLYRDSLAVPGLVKLLLAERDPVRQFHFFQSLAKIPSGWSAANETHVLDWALSTQNGWFADFNTKGVEFPLFFQSALEEFAANHKAAILGTSDRIQLQSLLGSALLGLIAESDPARLVKLYEDNAGEAQRIKILQSMARVRTEQTATFLRNELGHIQSPLLRKAALASLKAMHASRENEAFLKEPAPSNKPERPDVEIYNTLLAASLDSGDAMRGRRIYERLLCNTCHAGGQTPGQEGRLFGPDLAGVTSRLTRAELADAIVYPSKQVQDRFKAMSVSLRDGRELTGFITDRAADHVTFADATTVHRLTPTEIQKIAPQEKSLMPEGLLRTLNDQEIAHLLKFLSTIGSASR